MARRDRGNSSEPESVKPDDLTPSTDDDGTHTQIIEGSEPTDADPAPSTDAPAAPTTPVTPTATPELTDEQVAAALEPFLAVAEEAVSESDTATGVPPETAIDSLNKAYAALDGVKLKNRAKAALGEAMKAAMNDMNIVRAKSFMLLNDALKSVGGKKATGTKTPKTPVDPTEAFVERVAVLELARSLVEAPESVSDDWEGKVETALSTVDESQVAAYRNWLVSDAEDKGDAPEVSSVIQAAVKLSLGKSAKPGKAPKRATSGGGSSYDGPRREISKHISQAFADKDSGDFMKISEIRTFVSDEYGTDHPSAGAINARLFPSSGKCTLTDVTPSTDSAGNRGAVKN